MYNTAWVVDEEERQLRHMLTPGIWSENQVQGDSAEGGAYPYRG